MKNTPTKKINSMCKKTSDYKQCSVEEAVVEYAYTYYCIVQNPRFVPKYITDEFAVHDLISYM